MVWYQGEANSAPQTAGFYQYQLPLLIKDWRGRWGYDFPVAWVQLPNYDAKGRDWPTIREAMLKTLSVPNTGMAVAIDLGEKNDIHPKNKQDIGHRCHFGRLAKSTKRKLPRLAVPCLPDMKCAEVRLRSAFQTPTVDSNIKERTCSAS